MNVLSVLSPLKVRLAIGCDQGEPYPGRESWSNTNAVDSCGMPGWTREEGE